MVRCIAQPLNLTMIGTDMKDTAQLEMKIHEVKDKLSAIETKADSLEEQMKEFRSIADDIRVQLAILRGKL